VTAPEPTDPPAVLAEWPDRDSKLWQAAHPADTEPRTDMTPDEMLEILTEYGDDARSDFNDSDAVMGWFGWSVTGDRNPTLTISWTSNTEGRTATTSWRLVPLATPPVSEPPGEKP
jgi:hypothetical protein